MRALIQKKMLILAIPAALLCVSASPGLLHADDEKDKTTPPAKAAPAKPDASAAGLTERERMLLDRVEQLEKRVAELEGKKDGGAPSTAAAVPAVATEPVEAKREVPVASGANAVATNVASPSSSSATPSAST